MKYQWIKKYVLLFIILPLSVFGGVTGKIRGTIKDVADGARLPGANIFISHVWQEGKEIPFDGSIGAASNIDGEFIILQVPPGTYSVTASIIGYGKQLKQNVHVSVDRTTTINFDLDQEVLDIGGEVVVQAQRDIIKTDVASTESYISESDYQNTPFANRVEEIISLQSGVSGNIMEGEIKIREGDAMEVGFLMDGMDMFDQKFNRPVISIQPGAVEEIKLMRNGFNAEYGQSRSGVINVITKNPEDRLHFSLDYQLTPAQKGHVGRDKYDHAYRTEWLLKAGANAFDGGSILVPDGIHDDEYTWIGWNAYAEELANDPDPSNDLSAEEAFELWQWRHRPVEYGNKTGHNIDATLSGRVPILPWKSNFLLGGKFEYRPFQYPQSRRYYDERIGSLKIVNTLSPNMKLTLNNMYSEVRSVTEGKSNSSWSHEDRVEYDGTDLRGEYMYYPFYRPILNRYTTVAGATFTHTLSPTTFYEIKLSHLNINWNIGRPDSAKAEDGRYFHGRLYYDPQSGWISRANGVEDPYNEFEMYGGADTWDKSHHNATTLKAELTSQFHPAHELKAGLEFSYNDMLEDRTHWHEGDSTQLFTHNYHVFPLEMAAFVQDKVEFQGMIANIGLRMDYFDVNCDRPDPHQALTYDTNEDLFNDYVNNKYPTFRPKPKVYFSPRVGISHPLSDRSKIYFNYGHFVQVAASEVLYHTMVDWSLPRVTFMGNADIDFPTNIAYELGADFGIKYDLQLHFGAFYKDYDGYESGMVYAHGDQTLVLEWYDQNNYKEIRGIEIELRKPMGRFVTGWFNYNFIKESEANLEIPNLSNIPIITDDPNIGNNGVLWGVPRSNINYIQPDARGVITLSAPADWGPKIGKFPLVSNSNLSFQVFYKGGTRRKHPRDSFNDEHPDVWFKELNQYWANMRFSRVFSMFNTNMEFYMDVSNILHSKFRNIPGGDSKEDYYDDLWNSGRLDELGTDELTNPKILRTWSDNVYWGEYKSYVFGLRIHR